MSGAALVRCRGQGGAWRDGEVAVGAGAGGPGGVGTGTGWVEVGGERGKAAKEIETLFRTDERAGRAEVRRVEDGIRAEERRNAKLQEVRAEADKGAKNRKARDKRPRAVNWIEDPREIGARVYIFEFFSDNAVIGITP